MLEPCDKLFLAEFAGVESVSREDIMEAIERAKYGINDDRQRNPNTISKELVKLFPWVPSFVNRNDPRRDGQGLGYQTLS